MFKHEWVWKKSQGSNFANLKYAPFKEHESVLVFSNKAGLVYNPIMQERSDTGKKRKKYPIGKGLPLRQQGTPTERQPGRGKFPPPL